MKKKSYVKGACTGLVILLLISALAPQVYAQSEPGVDTEGIGPSAVTMGSIVPVVTETGKISLSVDGLGVYPANSGTIQVEKPAGATVRSAYMAAATTGFTNHRLADGDIMIDGVGIAWDIETRSSISSWNYWADVTSIVKSKIDAAPAGRVDFTITEKSSDTYKIDGEILAVIFDDPNQTTDNTIVLLFGAQDIAGDTFAIGLAEPIDTSDPNLVLDMSLGISFGYQRYGGGQYSIVEVNGVRLTTSAGGEDDGDHSNGALLTVGGLDDSNANPPDPYATPSNPRTDDELYNLIPFVSDGDTSIHVYTRNPSNDDNIFFASLFLASTTAVVGEGILLAPVSASNPVGSEHTVTATVQDDLGNPIVGRDVTFTIVSGPHAGLSYIDTTDANGQVTFTYTGTSAGTDVIEATMVDSQGNTVTSNQVTKEWTVTEVELCPDEYRWGCGGWCWDPFPDTFVGRQEVHFVNKGAFDVYNVTATVTCTPINVVATDPDVTLGDIPAGGSAWSSDTFELRVDMTNPQGPDKGICWRVEYDDAAGVHHVIENVPKFCGENCSDICP